MNLNPAQIYQAAMLALQSGDLVLAEQLLASLLAQLPDNLDVLYGLARIGFMTGRADLVVEMMRRCIQLDPADGGAHHNLGNALRSLGRHEEAIPALMTAIQLMPNPAEAHNTLGLTLKDLGRMTEAVVCFRKAVALNPRFVIAHSNLLLFLNYLPESTPGALLEEHRRWSVLHERPLKASQPALTNERDPDRRLRVGYVSADLRLHSVAYFLLPLLEHHNRSEVHITAYSNSAVADEISLRLQACVDSWCGIAGATDEQVAERIRADRIDILVDLSGHTAGNRLLVFARKPAPVQISWLGYCGSTGLDAMDYRCSDPLVDPPGDDARFSSEELLLLPRTAWCFAPLSGSPEVGPLPALTAPGITFGSFNNLGKISSVTLDLWAEILRQIPGSRLVLKNVVMGNSAAVAQLRESFKRRGIPADCVDLVGQDSSLSEHLNQYNRVDISLDTYPYHGTTTTCEALWMGVPTITLAGPAHASRPGVSLLISVGLADLVANTPEEYVQRAVRLAADRAALASLRKELRDRMLSSPLMDGRSFARAMEHSYRQVWHKCCGQ